MQRKVREGQVCMCVCVVRISYIIAYMRRDSVFLRKKTRYCTYVFIRNVLTAFYSKTSGYISSLIRRILFGGKKRKIKIIYANLLMKKKPCITRLFNYQKINYLDYSIKRRSMKRISTFRKRYNDKFYDN